MGVPRPDESQPAVDYDVRTLDFYGAAGWADGGFVSHKMSVIAVTIVAPVIAVLGSLLVARAKRIG